MAEAGGVGLGRLTLTRRERMVVVEPRGTGMALFTLRAAEEVRAAQFGMAEGELDAEMVAIAKTVHSFHTLLGDLATLTRNVVRLGRDHLTAILATPTRTQHRALDLLGVTPTA